MALLGITLPPTPLWTELENRLQWQIANSEYERVPIDVEPLRFVTGQLKKTNHHLVLGSFHVTDKTDKIKYLSQWPYTYGEIATEYIALCEETAGQFLRWEPVIENGKSVIYFTGPRRGNYAYVDITSCYFSLYSAATFDLRYNRQTSTVSLGRVPLIATSQLRLHKTIRNMIFGIMRKARGVEYLTDKGYTSTDAHSRYYKPDLTAYVLDTVQAIAQEAKQRFHLHMWLTDAAILPMSEAQDFQRFLREEWSLNSEIKYQGPSSLFSSNCFQVGQHVTEQLKGFTIQKGSPINTMEPVNVPALKFYRRELVKWQR